MRAFTTIFLTHTLSAILELASSKPQTLTPISRDWSISSFTLLERIEQLRNEDLPGPSVPHA